jgi:hypothetical protein
MRACTYFRLTFFLCSTWSGSADILMDEDQNRSVTEVMRSEGGPCDRRKMAMMLGKSSAKYRRSMESLERIGRENVWGWKESCVR